MSTRVLIVDDNPAFLDASRVLLEREGLNVVDVTSTAAEGLRRAQELQPDVVLVDIMLSGESGFELTRRLVEQCSGDTVAVILISTHDEADFVDLIADCPSIGFLPKSALSADAIRGILDGPSNNPRVGTEIEERQGGDDRR